MARSQRLTTARYACTRKANAVFNLGLTPEQIVAREQWLDEFSSPKGHHVDIEGVRIDNGSSRMAHVAKCEYLGIDARRRVLVSDYFGHPSDRFSKDWPTVVEQVRERM